MTRKASFNPVSLLIGLGLSALLLLLIMILAPDIRISDLLDRVGWPITRIILFVGLGLIIGEVIEASGWTASLAVLARPFFRYANLGNRCSAAFTTAFFSGVAANGMLVSFYRNFQISKAQLYLTNFINHFPAFFLHLPTTVFIILPLTGLAGGIYLLLVFMAVLLRTGLFILYGHLCLPVPEAGESEQTGTSRSSRASASLQTILTRVPRRLARIIQFVIPIYLLVFLFKTTGGFDFLQEIMAGSAINAIIPVESLSMVIISFIADYTSGFATAGALLNSEVLTAKQAILALVIGNVIAAPIRTLRHQLPRYLGIFSPGMGTQILLLGQGFRIASLLLIGAVYYLVA